MLCSTGRFDDAPDHEGKRGPGRRRVEIVGVAVAVLGRAP
jgi:hypothetical protein